MNWRKIKFCVVGILISMHCHAFGGELGAQYMFVSKSKGGDTEEKIVGSVWTPLAGQISWGEMQRRIITLPIGSDEKREFFFLISDETLPLVDVSITAKPSGSVNLPSGEARIFNVEIKGLSSASVGSEDGSVWHDAGLRSISIEGRGVLVIGMEGDAIAGWLDLDRVSKSALWVKGALDSETREAFESAWARLPLRGAGKWN